MLYLIKLRVFRFETELEILSKLWVVWTDAFLFEEVCVPTLDVQTKLLQVESVDSVQSALTTQRSPSWNDIWKTCCNQNIDESHCLILYDKHWWIFDKIRSRIGTCFLYIQLIHGWIQKSNQFPKKKTFIDFSLGELCLKSYITTRRILIDKLTTFSSHISVAFSAFTNYITSSTTAIIKKTKSYSKKLKKK